MSVDKLINLLAVVTLIQMKITIGMGIHVTMAVGLTVILAASSTLLAPLLLGLVLPVIATGSFPNTPAITSESAYAVLTTFVIALLALAWGTLTPQMATATRKAMSQPCDLLHLL